LISQHLPALQVVVPLLAAPLCVLLHRAALAWCVALAASWSAFAIAVALLAGVRAGGPVGYAIGGWAAPWGIEYRIDFVNALVLVVVSAVGAVIMIGARRSVAQEIAEDRAYLFYAAYLLNLSGLLGVLATADIFNLFVFVEIASLSTYALVSLGYSRRALLAAFRYLVLGTLGATFVLIGIGYLYAVTGTLNMADMAVRLDPVEHSRTVRTALAFLTIGLSLKLALFPLHIWLPDAYTHAPSTVSTLLASTTTKVFVYVLLRVIFGVFGADFVFATLQLDRLLLPLAVAGMLFGSIVAIFQQDLKRMLAYSSIAQIGYMVLGLGLASATGIAAALLHVFNHALMKAALFSCMACVVYRIGSAQIGDAVTLGRQMPWTLAAFVLGGLSLIGVPFTVGFVSKWYLLAAALESGSWLIAALIVFTSLLAIVYIWRVVEAAYFRAVPAGSRAAQVREAPLALLMPLWLLVAANLYFGIQSSLTAGVAEAAGALLLGAGHGG
jgi:multicomponent Na+:H+ antiporter subunit D